MTMRPWNLSFAKRPHGFSLVEMAIVLGLIGLVIGALFSLGGSLGAKNTLNQAVDELGVIANNVRVFYDGKQTPTGLTACSTTPTFTSAYAFPPSGTSWTLAQYTSSGIFPSEMLHTVGSAVAVNNPWNGNSATSTVKVDLCGASPVQLVVRYTNLKAQACVDMVMRTSALSSGMNLNQIIVSGSTNSTPIPTISSSSSNGAVMLSNAIAHCTPSSATTGVTIDWYYRLNG